MSQWMNKLDIKDIWAKLEDEELDVSEGGKQIAERFRALRPRIPITFYAQQLDDIAYAFEDIEEGDKDGFNAAMSDLYDWGDTSLDGKFGGKKLCWIATVM